MPDAVIGTIETGGESASIPAAGVSAAASVAASVGGGNRSHLDQKYIVLTIHRVNFARSAIFLFALMIVVAV